MREPLVSVLIPVRNAAAYLLASLRSVERQTESNWECVVVDDGSEDASAQVAAKLALRDARFRVVRIPQRGLVAALNVGLEQTRGRYVARLDGDDWMHRRRLAEQLEQIEAYPGWAGLGCHVRLFPRRGLGEGNRAYERWLNGIRSAEDVRREAFIECPLAHPSWLFRREILIDSGYRDRGWPEDYDLLLRLLTEGLSVGVLPRRRLGWRNAPQRLSRTSESYSQASFGRCRAHFLARSFLADGERYGLWGYGATGRRLRRDLAAEGKQPGYIVEVHPRRIGETIHGAPVIAPADLPRAERLPLVVSVAGAGPRSLIRGELDSMGFVEIRDYVCAA